MNDRSIVTRLAERAKQRAVAASRRRTDRLEVPCPVLREMYETRQVPLPAGGHRGLGANISGEHADALHRTVLATSPTEVVEIGMACGASSLAILTALDELGGERRLRSVDPWQLRHYGRAGVHAVERAGFGGRHELVARPDHLALPQLEEAGLRIQFAYVDGLHTFDRTLLDFFYLDRLLDVGGVIAFNDAALPAVHRVTRFVTRHRRYEEVDVGLPDRYLTSSVRTSVGRMLLRRPKRDRYFRKVETWEPRFDYWRRF